ncbi:hypothetical protein GOV09_05595 [Candidatus Woesearchaeota archaeon]|nr:hypothetical protein [Candidatus Woesearchaeota archaeon]
MIGILVIGFFILIIGLILHFLPKKIKAFHEPRIKILERQLPGLNCGKCGHTTCYAYAKQIVENDDPTLCPYTEIIPENKEN